MFENPYFTLWIALTWLIGVGWLRRHLDIYLARREPALAAQKPPDRVRPRLTVLVAAKDEGENIRRCLDTLLAQDYPDLQVVAINDRSQDDTGRIIDEIARREPRLTAVHVRELPDGWFGKNHAMHLGVAYARGEWLSFTDADCTFESPHLLAAAVDHAQQQGLDFLSVLPRLQAHGFWEKVIQPVAGGVLMVWYPPRRVNNPRSACAYANGAFMLLPRRAYERLGGHVPVRATLNEDMHLARRAKRFGLRLAVVRGAEHYSVRMYEGLPQIWRGWTRIFYGCFGTFPKLLASALLLSIFSLMPYVTIALAPLAGSKWLYPAAAGAFATVAQQTVLWVFYRLTGVGPWLALTYPLGAAVCLGMTLNAMRRLGGNATTHWRGTTYRGGARADTDAATVGGLPSLPAEAEPAGPGAGRMEMPMSADNPKIDLGTADDGLWVGVRGRATQRVCPTVDQLVADYAATCEQAPQVTIDLSGCDWIDSTFAGWLTGLKKRLARRAGRLRLVGCSARCLKSLARMHLAEAFEIAEAARPGETREVACLTGDRPDSAALKLMLAAHEDLSGVSDENAKVFGPIVEALRGQLQPSGK